MPVFDEVVTYRMVMVAGLECEERPVRDAIRRHGCEHLTVPHWELPKILKSGYAGPVPRGAHRMRSLRQRDIEQALRDRTGCGFVLLGHREGESLSRLAMLRACKGYDEAHFRAYPLHRWRTATVHAYLKAHKIVAPPAGFGHGISVHRPASMAWLEERGGEDWRKWLEVFPYSGAIAERYRMRLRAAHRAGTSQVQ